MDPHCVLLTPFCFVWASFWAVLLKHLASGSITTQKFSVFSNLIIFLGEERFIGETLMFIISTNVFSLLNLFP